MFGIIVFKLGGTFYYLYYITTQGEREKSDRDTRQGLAFIAGC